MSSASRADHRRVEWAKGEGVLAGQTAVESSPVFVAGCGRSGTTVLAAELGARFGFTVPPEQQFTARGILADSGVRPFVASLQQDWRLRLWGLDDLGELLRELARKESVTDVIRGLVAAYEAQRGHEASWWVDHTPSNIQEGEALLRAFPDSPLIHVVRDPRAVAASVLTLDWGPRTARNAAGWWSNRLAAGLALEGAYPDRVIRVRFEDLVLAPDATVGTIGKWLTDVAAVPMTSTGARAAALPGYTRTQHALVGGPMRPERVDAWRSAMSPRDIAVIEGELGGLIELMGYTRALPASGREPVRLSEVATDLRSALTEKLARSRRRRRRAR